MLIFFVQTVETVVDFRHTQKQLDYANSPAFKAKYSGTSKGNSISGARANSVIGTNADPYRSIRQAGMGVPDATIGVKVYKWYYFINEINNS